MGRVLGYIAIIGIGIMIYDQWRKVKKETKIKVE